MKIEFNSIDEIKKHEWAGNHYNDCRAFMAVEQFVRDNSDIEQQREALYIMGSKAMGIHEPVTNSQIQEYLNF